jgi:hypothetical protein
MDGGMLVFHAQAGAAVGLLLPDRFEAGKIGTVEDDLRRLLDGVRRRPQLVALTQAQAQEAEELLAPGVEISMDFTFTAWVVKNSNIVWPRT